MMNTFYLATNSNTSRVKPIRFGMFLLLMLFGATAMAEELDRRQVIELNDAQRAHVLIEMRAMLSGTQNILAALAANDMEELARHARLLGTKAKHNAENNVHDALPPAFMKLGMSVHQAFDRIADDAEAGGDSQHALSQLSLAMNTCVVCHETYQIQRVANQKTTQTETDH